MTGDWIPNTPFGAWPCAHLLEYTPFRRCGLTVAEAQREIAREAGEIPEHQLPEGYWDDEIERQFHYEVKGG